MKAAYADVPWHKIYGLGNMLRHEYRRIDPSILWSVITDYLVRPRQVRLPPCSRGWMSLKRWMWIVSRNGSNG